MQVGRPRSIKRLRTTCSERTSSVSGAYRVRAVPHWLHRTRLPAATLLEEAWQLGGVPKACLLEGKQERVATDATMDETQLLAKLCFLPTILSAIESERLDETDRHRCTTTTRGRLRCMRGLGLLGESL